MIVIVYAVLQISSVQTWAVSKLAENLSEKLDTKVSIKKVNFRFFNKLVLEGLMVEDRKKDTLLYAGKAQADVTDWFIFKDKIVLKNVSFENTIVHMNRTDSVWNYQFIIDYFVSPNKQKKKKESIEIDLKELHLKNIIFNKSDKWIGQDLYATLQRLDLISESINFNEKNIAIREIYLEKPVFSQTDYTGNKPPKPNLRNLLEKIPVVSALKWNNSGWRLSVKKFAVFDGKFLNDKFTIRAPYTDRFDGQHIALSEINGNLDNIIFQNDTLRVDISLKAKEKSGLEVKKLQSNLKFTPELMEFNNLDLQTNQSRLGNYYSMSYQTFNKDMGSFIHNVLLNARFESAVIYSDDLAFFAPELKSWNRIFELDGDAKGTIDNFTAKNMRIQSGNSLIEGDLSLRGLPDFENSYIDFSSKNLITNYDELVTVIPNLRNVHAVSIEKLGNIRFTGNFTGYPRDFVTYGDIKTDLGDLKLDLNMKIPQQGLSAYSGLINTKGFNVGAFSNSKNLGIVAIQGKIDGSGFSVKNLHTSFKGTAPRFDFNGYSYQKIALDGAFEKQIFNGNFSINDPNLKIDTLVGALNLSGKDLAFNFKANVQRADLQALHFVKSALRFSGNFDLNFSGNNIDNFLGTARISNARLMKDTNNLSFDSLTLTSKMMGDKKVLSLQTNEIDANIEGKFTIMQLPDAFKLLLSTYYPTYIKKPTAAIENQNFIFNVRTNKIDEYIRLLNPKLRGFDYSAFQGSLNMMESILNLEATVPQFSYDGKQFSNTTLKGMGSNDTLYADIQVEEIKISDSLKFPDTHLKLTAHNDVSNIQLITRAGKILNQAELNASIQTLPDGIKIHFSPSSFVINDKKWLLEKDGELTLRKRYIDADEVRFVQGDQEIVLSTIFDELTDDTHLTARLRNVVIEDFAPLIVKDPKLKGILTGSATIRNPFETPVIEFTGISDSFSLNDQYIGKINLDANVHTGTGVVTFNTSSKETDYSFNLDGIYRIKDSTGNKMDINFLADRFNISILEPYLGSVFSKMDGIATGNLKISGVGNETYLTGQTTITGGKLKIAYTQSSYSFDRHTIQFDKNLIDLGVLQLKDSLNNTGTVSGKMHHRFFKSFRFENIRFETGKMIVLNTTKKDNTQFYGYVIGSALMTLNGPVTNLRMNIDGQPSSIDSSHIFLPTGESKESNLVDYIDFVQFGTEMTSNLKADQSTNILVNMNIVTNPAAKVDVILDEETGDIIKGQGNGKLNIVVGTREPLSIRGRFEITKGEYTFNFQTFLKKPFTLNQGSINWNGDPYEAIIDMEAEYLAKNVDISSLTLTNNFRQKADITILSHLTGVLQRPKINFEFKLPERSEFNRDYVVVNKLANFKNDENAMNKQVASLLLFNSFILENQNFLSQENTFALATNTIGGMMSGWLTNIFNTELERATDGVISTWIDINPTVSLQSTASQLQANIRAGLKILLSNRLNILIGGNLDYNNPYSTTADRKGLFTPDITIEWLLNKDGSLRVVGFNRTSIDITSGQRNRSGAQLSYRKDFNKITDIFKSRKRLKEEADKNTKVTILP